MQRPTWDWKLIPGTVVLGETHLAPDGQVPVAIPEHISTQYLLPWASWAAGYGVAVVLTGRSLEQAPELSVLGMQTS